MTSANHIKPLRDQKILVLGAARQGLALTRFFLLHGSEVVLNDSNTEKNLSSEINDMQKWIQENQSRVTGSLQWHLGNHPQHLLDGCDVLFVSGGVPLTLPIIQEAQKRSIPISNDSQVFMDEVPCPVIGITGSAGKTTSTALLGKILQTTLQTQDRKIWVGGNIGLPLIEQVEEMNSEDLVLLELSSFQLDQMNTVPQIAAILNLTPNHLDRHGTMEAYIAAKANVLRYQKPSDWAVLNHEDANCWQLQDFVQGNLATFGMKRANLNIPQTYLQNDHIFLFDGNEEQVLLNTAEIQLRGRHNIMNVLAVCLLAHLSGVPLQSIRPIIKEFRGVEHRLELVRIHNDVQWYNDSIATTPERSMAAIRSFSEPLVLLLGGKDKDLPWEKLTCLVHRRVHDVILFGEASEKVETILRKTKNNTSLTKITKCNHLKDAVKIAAKIVHPGDVVLLSPGGTSYDEFKDFAERGERYRQWVNQIL